MYWPVHACALQSSSSSVVSLHNVHISQFSITRSRLRNIWPTSQDFEHSVHGVHSEYLHTKEEIVSFVELCHFFLKKGEYRNKKARV